jgi:hypothetical protein
VWLNVFEQLRRVEETNPEVERLKKKSVLISGMELSKLHGKIPLTMLDALPDGLTHRLVGLEATAVRSELCQEVDRHMQQPCEVGGDLAWWIGFKGR